MWLCWANRLNVAALMSLASVPPKIEPLVGGAAPANTAGLQFEVNHALVHGET